MMSKGRRVSGTGQEGGAGAGGDEGHDLPAHTDRWGELHGLPGGHARRPCLCGAGWGPGDEGEHQIELESGPCCTRGMSTTITLDVLARAGERLNRHLVRPLGRLQDADLPDARGKAPWVPHCNVLDSLKDRGLIRYEFLPNKTLRWGLTPEGQEEAWKS